jgi:hypothetical protein
MQGAATVGQQKDQRFSFYKYLPVAATRESAAFSILGPNAALSRVAATGIRELLQKKPKAAPFLGGPPSATL